MERRDQPTTAREAATTPITFRRARFPGLENPLPGTERRGFHLRPGTYRDSGTFMQTLFHVEQRWVGKRPLGPSRHF
jgi:hypothetical protein